MHDFLGMHTVCHDQIPLSTISLYTLIYRFTLFKVEAASSRLPVRLATGSSLCAKRLEAASKILHQRCS